MLKVFYKNESSFELEKENDLLKIDGELFPADVQKVAENRYHIIKDHQSFNVEIIASDFKSKNFTIKVNGNIYELKAKNQLDLLLEKLGMNNGSEQKVNEIKAPMPGLILDILVKPGNSVAKGDKILILEAMKMENMLKSPGDGVLKSIEVKVGENVEKNQVLVKFE
ncbi:acetyl-CoA carboxylase biotin carboxyl carrier protein subunit [Flexithrix dorotheae]|uniref:acetyl-CoA carboxylase biotin carboxyl carrier protein subunit n=1 Tax=Flexithrix dorotheae TaxID=70993 RepID=UPI0003613423|nr:acetyl-CoA carboxylase biotin carboxyl carrier protein subunit [Flexithrix dorotheae]